MNDPASLKQLAGELQACRRCPLYRHATQVVPGEGPARAKLMLVGEQPGNDEDLAGRPFVGSAGHILDEALEDAGIARDKVYLTNAVKHFKFVPRGKRRLHHRPNAEEVRACHLWYEAERRLVRPLLTVALGATAARSVLGRAETISAVRGKILDLPDGGHATVTIHPSFLLRIRDAQDRTQQKRNFVADLRRAAQFIAS